MREYRIYIHYYENDATSMIDYVSVDGEYSTEQYLEDCKENADKEWYDMVKNDGDVYVEEIIDED